MTIASIRLMRSSDIPFAVRLKLGEGWDVAQGVMETHLAHDASGCFVAELVGEPVGMITSTLFRSSAFVGNLIVHPDHRRHGIGGLLMRRTMKHLYDSGARLIQLEADPPGVNLYRRLGFADLYESLRFTNRRPKCSRPSGDNDIAPLTNANLSEIAEFDKRYFGDDRSELLASILKYSPGGYLSRKDSRVRGYLIAQNVGEGLRIGPAVAEDAKVFATLLDSLLTAQKAPRYAIGISALNESGIAVLRERGFEPGSSSLRMIHGEEAGPDDPRHVFAIAGGDRG